MKKIIILFLCIVLSGCGNLSPRNGGRSRIKNRRGEVQSQQKEVQGTNKELKIEADKDNSGVQILSGADWPVLILSGLTVLTGGFLIFQGIKTQKTIKNIIKKQPDLS